MRFRAIFAVVATLVALPARAAEPEKEIARCATKQDALERLECLETIAKELGLVTETTLAPSSGKWRVYVDTNPMDDTKTVALVLTADRGLARFGQKPKLMLRCRSNKSEAYINWHDFLGSDNPEVTSRIGSQPAQTRRWSLSTDQKATFYPGNHIEFIKALASATSFAAQITPYGENPITAVFDTTGLAEPLKLLAETCNWKK